MSSHPGQINPQLKQYSDLTGSDSDKRVETTSQSRIPREDIIEANSHALNSWLDNSGPTGNKLDLSPSIDDEPVVTDDKLQQNMQSRIRFGPVLEKLSRLASFLHTAGGDELPQR